MFSEDLVDEIDLTLDKLIENANAMKSVELTKEEIEAFQKTQESLLAHLVSLDQLLQIKRKILNLPKRKQITIKSKMQTFQRLNSSFIKNTTKQIKLIKIRRLRKNSKKAKI